MNPNPIPTQIYTIPTPNPIPLHMIPNPESNPDSDSDSSFDSDSGFGIAPGLIATHLMQKRLRWYGHVRRRYESHITRTVLDMEVEGVRREEDRN